MRKKAAALHRFPVSVVVDGKKYLGTYTVSGPGAMATVTVHASGGTKRTHAGSSAEAIASDLLRELVYEAKAGPGGAVAETSEAKSEGKDAEPPTVPETDATGDDGSSPR